MEELKTTYLNFLHQLIKTNCLYKGDTKTDLSVIKRIETLYELIESVNTNSSEKKITSYINGFKEYYNLVQSKKPIELTNINFFQYFCKAMEKKSNKAGFIFFLNDRKVNINIGLIAKNQSSHNFCQIKNFIYIMYVQCCNILDVKNEIYEKILEDFNIEHEDSIDDVKEQIKDLCSSVIEEILPEEFGNKEMLNDVFKNKEFNSIFDNIMNNMGGNIKEELKKTKKQDVTDFVKSMKKDFEKMNIFEMLSNFNIDDITGSLDNVKSHLKDVMGNDFNPEEFDKHMDNYVKMGEEATQKIISEMKVTVTEKESEPKENEEPTETEPENPEPKENENSDELEVDEKSEELEIEELKELEEIELEESEPKEIKQEETEPTVPEEAKSKEPELKESLDNLFNDKEFSNMFSSILNTLNTNETSNNENPFNNKDLNSQFKDLLKQMESNETTPKKKTKKTNTKKTNKKNLQV
jgi:hypothetical protein